MPIIVLHGSESFLIAERTREVRAALEQAHGKPDVFAFDGASVSAAEVLDECRSFGLMAGHKLVIVDNAQEFVKEHTRPLLERYAQAPAEGATLLLRATRWFPGNLDKLIVSAGGAVVKCAAPDRENEARPWALMFVARRVGKHQAAIEPEASEKLYELVGPDLGRLDSELAKLAVAAALQAGHAAATKEQREQRPPVITAALVSELVGATRVEDKVWVIQTPLLSGEPERAVRAVRECIGQWRQPWVRVNWQLADTARRLYAAAQGLRAGQSPQAMAGSLKVWGDSMGPFFAAAKRLGPAGARRLLRDCVEADARGKSGLGDPDRTCERLAVRYALGGTEGAAASGRGAGPRPGGR
jgi:DNA polymerase III delta subunit